MINEELLEKTIAEVLDLVENRFQEVGTAEYIEGLQALIEDLEMHVVAAEESSTCRNIANLANGVTEQLCADEDTE
jgi:hypothetical protein